MLAGVDRLPCPDGHAGTVLLAGKRKSRDGKTERHRYWCVPDNGEERHRFTPPLPGRRSTDHSGAGHRCDACERVYRQGDGVRTAHRFLFSIREMASALVRVGRGESYRAVSLSLRREMDREKEGPNLVINYLDALAPVVIEPLARQDWPSIVVLDAWPIRVRLGPKQPRRVGPPFGVPLPPIPRVPPKQGPRRRVEEVGRVLAASGKDTVSGKTIPLLVRFAGGGDESSWAEFLRSLPGTPEWVVADRDRGITNAVETVWRGTPLLYYSEHHLLANAREAARLDGHRQGSRLWDVLGDAQRDPEGLAVALALAESLRARKTTTWLKENRPLLTFQMAARRPDHPRSTGAVEGLLSAVRKHLNDRKHMFRNADRLDRTLALIRAEQAGLASERLYASLLRDHLAQREVGAPIFWKDLLDPKGTSSMRQMVKDAAIRSGKTKTARRAPRKSARMLARHAALAREREASGLPPAPRGRPQRIPATESVAGKSVADFPWLVAEWHPTKNLPLTPDKVPAGTGELRWWMCEVGGDHEWLAQVRSRSIRGVRCPFCLGRKAAPSQVLAVTDPDLAAQWHPTKNGDLTPDKVTRGSHREAWWQCPAYKTHVWQARISSRTSMLSGCPDCARTANKGGRPRKKGSQRSVDRA
jgi:hypothetical protein